MRNRAADRADEGRYVGSSIENGHTTPDIIKITRAYGFKIYDINTNGEMAQILPVIMDDDEPMLCILHMDPNETVSPRVKAYVGKNGEIRSWLLENMWLEI